MTLPASAASAPGVPDRSRTGRLPASQMRGRPWLLRPWPGWLPAAVLLAVTAVVGPVVGGLMRPVFVLGCLAAGWYAWRLGPGPHLQAVLTLFVLAPCVRRLVDLSAGFDQSSIMLIGPLLAILVTVWDLRVLLHPGRPRNTWLVPPLIVLGCVAYGTALSLFQADWFNAANGFLKWTAPVLYGMALQQRVRPGGDLAQAAARAFAVLLPITGLYGVVQYVDPQAWDRYWMLYASITSAGFPEPYAVRVFSTMNGPASYATFTATGLLLVGFLRPGWQSVLVMMPAALGLLLSLYRTAWIALALGVVFCMLFAATRRRAVATAMGIVIAAAVAITVTPFGAVIGDRLQTFSGGTQDGSGGERLEEFVTLWNTPDSMAVGAGFTMTDAGSAGAMPIDGQIIACWLTMGIPVGLLCIMAYIWTAGMATAGAWRDPTQASVVLAALALTAVLIQMPLASLASGELSVLFWMLAALACPRQAPPARIAAPRLPR